MTKTRRDILTRQDKVRLLARFSAWREMITKESRHWMHFVHPVLDHPGAPGLAKWWCMANRIRRYRNATLPRQNRDIFLPFCSCLSAVTVECRFTGLWAGKSNRPTEENSMRTLMNARVSLPVLAGIALMSAALAQAGPVALSAAQMDSVAAAGVETVNGFVCPVITTENVLNSPRGGELGIEGFYTIGGPDVTVPVRATNGDGAGHPGGPFSQPGDTNYTAIWGCCR